MRYLCLIYYADEALARLSDDEREALLCETLAWSEEMSRAGHYIAASALQFSRSAISIRVRNENIYIFDSAYSETPEQVGGYVLIEARDLNDAIRVAATLPAARLGGVEVRPVRELTQATLTCHSQGAYR